MENLFCKICGKECTDSFRSLESHFRQNHNIYKKKYYDKFLKKENEGICPECGKETTFRSLRIGYQRFCSSKCRGKSKEVREKSSETQKENNKNPEIKEDRYKRTQLSRELNKDAIAESYKQAIEKRREKYNGNIYDVNKFKETISKRTQEDRNEIIKKQKNTKFETYGDENFNNREKALETMLDRRPDDPTNREKYKETMLETWGVDNVFKDVDYIQAKRLEKCPNYFHKDRSKWNIDPETERLKIEKIGNSLIERWNVNLKELLSNKPYEFVGLNHHHHSSQREIILKCLKCQNTFDIQFQMLKNRIIENLDICRICNPFHPNCSRPQKEIKEFIESISNYFVSPPTKKIIGKELDIYVPELKFAIEYNGSYWHNVENQPDQYYHSLKCDLCYEKEINLLHVFEDEWDVEQGKIKDLIEFFVNGKNIDLDKYITILNDRIYLDRGKCLLFFNQYILDTGYNIAGDIEPMIFNSYDNNDIWNCGYRIYVRN